MDKLFFLGVLAQLTVVKRLAVFRRQFLLVGPSLLVRPSVLVRASVLVRTSVSRQPVIRTFVFTLPLLTAAMTAADVYRWVDSEGKTHYGDRAPAEQRNSATRLNIKKDTGGIDPEAERARQQLRSMQEGKQREREVSAQKMAEDVQRQQETATRCRQLRDEIRDDQNVAVFYRYDEQGNRVLWTSEERLAYREKLNNMKAAYCPDMAE